MWTWFHSGWIILVPIAMMVVCILMCVLMRGVVFGSRMMCCGPTHGKSDPKSAKTPLGDL